MPCQLQREDTEYIHININNVEPIKEHANNRRGELEDGIPNDAPKRDIARK